MRTTRRRFIAIVATATLGGCARENAITQEQFLALGTRVQITLLGEEKKAEAALLDCRKEVSAIESAFSLYDPSSMLSRLNRDRSIQTDVRFSTLLRHALYMAEITNGAFDPTVQPLWQAYANGTSIEQARQLINWRELILTPQTAHFEREGMAASFNGIAQGFAADLVSHKLAEHNFTNTLVDLGEFSASGTKMAKPWLLGIHNPVDDRIAAQIEVTNNAVATSEPQATLIGGRSHIFDPLEQDGERWVSVTVEARKGWRADALSTAIAASPIDRTEKLLADGEASRAWLIDASGVLHEI